MAAEWMDASCVNYTSPFYLVALSTTASKQISGAYVFAYKQLNKSLLQQRPRRLLSPPSLPYSVVQQILSCVTQMLANNCWPAFVGRVSAAL